MVLSKQMCIDDDQYVCGKELRLKVGHLLVTSPKVSKLGRLRTITYLSNIFSVPAIMVTVGTNNKKTVIVLTAVVTAYRTASSCVSNLLGPSTMIAQTMARARSHRNSREGYSAVRSRNLPSQPIVAFDHILAAVSG